MNMKGWTITMNPEEEIRGFDPSTDGELDFLDNQLAINYLSDDFLIDNIVDQITTPKAHQVPVDYLTLLDRRYNVLIDKYNLDSKFSHEIKQTRLDLYKHILETMEDKFSLASGVDDETLVLDILGVTTSLYTVFVLDFKQNLTLSIVQWILDNKEEIINQVKDDIPNGDISFNGKTDQDTTTLLLSLDKIVDQFRYMHNDVLFEYMISQDEGEFSNVVLQEKYRVGELTPKVGFADYITLVLSPGLFRDDIITNVKMYLIKMGGNE